MCPNATTSNTQHHPCHNRCHILLHQHPNNETTQAAIGALSTLPSHTPWQPLKNFKTLLNFILKHNFFLFNNQTYLQMQGKAMGTRMAP